MEPEKQNNYEHNLGVLDELKPGDLIKFDRRFYSHYAVYCGNNNVVHLRGEPGGNVTNVFSVDGNDYDNVRAVVDNFWAVTKGNKTQKDNYLDEEYQPGDPDDIVEIAMGFTETGEFPYDLLLHNCEHFATYCRYGVEHCQQVEHLKQWLQKGAAGLKAAKVVSARLRKLKQRIKRRTHKRRTREKKDPGGKKDS